MSFTVTGHSECFVSALSSVEFSVLYVSDRCPAAGSRNDSVFSFLEAGISCDTLLCFGSDLIHYQPPITNTLRTLTYRW